MVAAVASGTGMFVTVSCGSLLSLALVSLSSVMLTISDGLATSFSFLIVYFVTCNEFPENLDQDSVLHHSFMLHRQLK